VLWHTGHAIVITYTCCQKQGVKVKGEDTRFSS
jgi:hypothetical protein